MEGDKRLLNLNPMTKVIIIMLASLTTFTVKNEMIGIILLAVLVILTFLQGEFKTGIKFGATYLGIVILYEYVFQILPDIISINFSILVLTIKKILPCLLATIMLVRTTSIRTLIYTMRRAKLPESFILPLMVTIRYFPTLREDVSQLNDALKLRNFRGIRARVNNICMPVITSASNIADDISQALITRGIDNPRPNTCIEDLGFKAVDFLILAVFTAILVAGYIY